MQTTRQTTARFGRVRCTYKPAASMASAAHNRPGLQAPLRCTNEETP
ncbi:hypothetical protein L493_3346 [Bordetella bronchiseptica 99-R-0433]|nr:hypothetical protein L493_3346 [Bordetella bronchiseptica 99-R-0433]